MTNLFKKNSKKGKCVLNIALDYHKYKIKFLMPGWLAAKQIRETELRYLKIILMLAELRR